MERKNIYIVVFMITTIIAAGVAVYFAVNPIAKNEDFSKDNSIVNEDVNNSNISNEKVENIQENNTNSSNVETAEKIVYKYLPSVENGKCLNAKENLSYYVSRSADFQGVTAYVGELGKSISLNVNWDSIKKAYGSSSLDEVTITGYKEYSITNFSKKIVNVYIDGMGQAIGQEVLLFLMEDGTVEYMPLHDSLVKQEFKSYGQIKSVSNIVDVVGGSAHSSIDGGPGPGWYTIFAINNEGNYYDIGAILQEVYFNK